MAAEFDRVERLLPAVSVVAIPDVVSCSPSGSMNKRERAEFQSVFFALNLYGISAIFDQEEA